MGNKLVACEWCATQTHAHMLDWHKGRCPSKPAENGNGASAPLAEVAIVEPPKTEVVDLDASERALIDQLAQIRAKRAELERAREEEARIKREQEEEARRQAAMNAEVIFRVLNVAYGGSHVVVRSDYRQDVVDMYRTIEGRSYNGTNNMIPFVKWPEFLDKVRALPRTKIEYEYNSKAEIEELSLPPWSIDIDSRHFTIKQGPRSSAHIIAHIPGNKYDAHRRKWLIPLTEGYRIGDVFKDVQGVVYSDEAHAAIIEQIERKAQIDKIAKLEDAPEIISRLTQVLTIDGKTATLGEHLRPFQRVGVKFMEQANGRALDCDEMGLGKSPQAIAYAQLIEAKRVLVICPASLKNNWLRQIKKFTEENGSVLSGGEPSNFDMVKLLTDPSRFTVINYDILGRKIEHLKEWTDEQGKHEEHQVRYLWVELLNMAKFDLVIVDEGHYIKTVTSARSQAVRKLTCPRIVFLTGTPVLNRPGELWPMLTMIAPETFPAYETFIQQYTYDGKHARNVEELRQVLRGIMIRRLKKDVVKELPPINRINEYHELGEKANKLYKKIEQGVYEEVAAYRADGVSRGSQSITSILTQIMRMKQVCAIDKVDRTAELAVELYDQTDESENRKVLIFSQFKAVAYAIAQRLGDDGVLCFVERSAKGWTTIDQAARDRMVLQFQTDPSIKYLVVTEKTTKEGHDITAAGHVIFNDLFWTPAAHEQAEGRAYGRLSDLHSINAYYMITDMGGASIEEWIMELLAAKMRMIHQVVEGVESGRDESILMSLIEKMRDNMWRK